MTPVKISLTIVTPTLNSDGTLAATLLSLAPLAKAGAKIVVVGSHSSDATVSVAAMYGAEIREAPAGNMSEAVNKGFDGSDTAWQTYIRRIPASDTAFSLAHRAGWV